MHFRVPSLRCIMGCWAPIVAIKNLPLAALVSNWCFPTEILPLIYTMPYMPTLEPDTKNCKLHISYDAQSCVLAASCVVIGTLVCFYGKSGRTTTEDRTQGHFGPPHLHVSEAFVEQSIYQWTLLLFNGVLISGPVFC